MFLTSFKSERQSQSVKVVIGWNTTGQISKSTTAAPSGWQQQLYSLYTNINVKKTDTGFVSVRYRAVITPREVCGRNKTYTTRKIGPVHSIRK